MDTQVNEKAPTAIRSAARAGKPCRPGGAFAGASTGTACGSSVGRPMFTVAEVISPSSTDFKADGLGACERVGDETAVARLHETAVDQVLRKAAHAVPAHLGQGSVGIDVVHVAGALGSFGRPHHDDAIGSYAAVAIAQRRHLGGVKLASCEKPSTNTKSFPSPCILVNSSFTATKLPSRERGLRYT